MLIGNRYWAYKNSESMDGLPGMKRGVETAKREDVPPIKKMVGPYATTALKKSSRRPSSTSPLLIAFSSFFAGIIVAVLLFEFSKADLQRGLVNYTEEIRSLLR